MKKRLAAVAIAFAAAMMVGVSAPAPAQAEVVESSSNVQQDFWDWRYIGAYSSHAACTSAGNSFEFNSLPAIVNTKCVKGNNDGRIVYKLYWRPFF
ncbi:hypothetical protein GCM10029992_08400 [Glycomyces albus]